MIARVRCAAYQAHPIGPQRHRVVQRDVVAEAVLHGDLDSQFFGQLAGQCGRFCFAVSDLSAGQFPKAGKFGWPVSLRHQDRRSGDDGAGDDDLIRHGQ